MSMFVSNEQAQDFLTQPVSGINGLSELVYNEAQQRYEVPGVGAIDIPDLSTNMAKGIARNVLQGYCSTADISQITDAEITQKAVEVATNMTAAEILQISDTTSSAYQKYATALGKKICDLATARKDATSPGFVMPKWGWPAIIVAAVIGGYFIFKGK